MRGVRSLPPQTKILGTALSRSEITFCLKCILVIKEKIYQRLLSCGVNIKDHFLKQSDLVAYFMALNENGLNSQFMHGRQTTNPILIYNSAVCYRADLLGVSFVKEVRTNLRKRNTLLTVHTSDDVITLLS